jgi:ankyrin repeat protein
MSTCIAQIIFNADSLHHFTLKKKTIIFDARAFLHCFSAICCAAMDDGTRIAPDVEEFLRAARARNSVRVAELLAGNASLLNSVEAGGFCALHFAAFNGDMDMMNVLLPLKPQLELKNYDGNTPLILAAKGRQQCTMRALIDAGADVNFQTSTGGSAAHFAASMGDLEGVRYLVSRNANILHEKSETGSLLHWAAHSGDVGVVGAMIYEFGIPVDITDLHGGTALFTALFVKKSDVVQFLLEHGADPQATIGGDLSTPLHIAVEHGDVADVKLLLAFGANPAALNNDKDTPVSLAEQLVEKRPELRTALKELTKVSPTPEKRAEDAARFKAHGNKVFAEGENVKAAKFYSLAIQLERSNHVFFSNRAACYFNLKQYPQALYDACRCIQLAPKWPKGYFRKGATQLALKNIAGASASCEEGLRLDPSSTDLINLKADILKAQK